MRVYERDLRIIMITHCKVNIKADGETLKYRYVPINPIERAWTCNGEVQEGMTYEVVKAIFEKYSNVEVTRKQQF